MSVEGFAQFGWLKKLFAVISQRSRALSWNRNSLARPAANTLTPGPLMTPLPDVPKCPGCGGTNAFGSNHRSSVRCPPDKLGLLRMSGRSVTEAGVKAILDGPKFWNATE